MKKLVSFLCAGLIISSTVSGVFAASGSSTSSDAKTASSSSTSKVDHFEVSTSSASVKPGEAVDLTVKAVDKNGGVKKDYAGTIYITVDNDTKATVPYADGYQFTAADLGQKTFSKGLSFTKEGKMKVIVMDIDNDQLEGNVEVTVGADSTGSTSSGTNGDITITSPDNGMTVADGKITVSGISKKNSKVQYFLNGTAIKELESQTDDKGNFMAEIKDVTQSTNIIQVKILDGSDKVIAESDKITVNMESSGPVFKSLTIKEGNEAPAGSQINVTLIADPGLTEVSAGIADTVQPLTENATNPGTYTGSITLPAQAGDYQIDATLKNNLGKTTTKKGVASIKALESNIFKNIKTVVSDKKVTFTFDLDGDKADYAKFKFRYGTSAETLKTAGDTQIKEAVSFEKDKIKTASGYSWYIGGLDPAVGKYYFQIIPVDKDGKDITGIQSDVVEVDFALSSAGSKCMISNVSGLKATKNGEVVDLSWDSIPEATSYNVYRKGEDGNFTLIENVSTNKYTLNISGDKLKYDDYAIKGVCGDGESKAESQDFSNVTKVQTGPAEVMFLLGLSLVIGYFYVRRRYAK